MKLGEYGILMVIGEHHRMGFLAYKTSMWSSQPWHVILCFGTSITECFLHNFIYYYNVFYLKTCLLFNRFKNYFFLIYSRTIIYIYIYWINILEEFPNCYNTFSEISKISHHYRQIWQNSGKNGRYANLS